MNIHGPSRVAPAARGRVESTYEEDLLRLIDQLSIADMNAMQTIFQQSARAGVPLSDREVAMNNFIEEARTRAVFDQDRALAQRIAAGEDIVEQAPAAVPRPNGPIQANNDPLVGQRAQQAPRNDTASNQTWGSWLSSMVGWAFGAAPVAETGSPAASTAAPRPQAPNRPTGHDCVICQDPIYGVEVRAPCGHYYGVDCVTDLFQSATRDESLFPPRCCRQNIPFTQVRPHLSQALVTTFLQKQTELGTLNRVYCSFPACSRFLGPVSEGIWANPVYTCDAPGCGRRTCGKCREQYTDRSHTCRPDASATQVLELGRAAGWARCPGCSQLIELHVGCFHMTCRCRTEFCYLCRARWKTCRCPQWDERRLLAAAEERVDAQLGVGRERGARRDVPAQRAAPVPPAAPVFAPARPAAPPRPAPRPVAPAQPQATARPLAPVRVPPQEARRLPPPPPPPRTAAPSTAAARLVNSREEAMQRVATWRELAASAAATASTPTSAPRTRDPRPPSWASTSAASAAMPSTSTRPKTTFVAPRTDPKRQRLVREMMERLRTDHECNHAVWRYRCGGGICQHCGHHLPLYLFRCQGCETLACNRCRRNRL